MNELRGLWRGKREDTKAWIIGDLMRGSDIIDCTEIAEHTGVGSRYDVIPETLGECTGLRDKNGKPIFEGDIVEFNNQRFEVQFSEEIAAFGLQAAGNFISASRFTSGILACASVIGNIHDNPELLKGVDKGNEMR